MSRILKVRNVNDYSRYLGCKEQHPLVSVIDYAEVSPVRHSLNDYGVYGIFFHDEAEIDLAYGCGKYDYKKGTVICVAPGQIGGKEDNGEEVMLTGWALLFHPDLLHGFPLEKRIKEYSFFDYRINEALHMTDEEHDILASLMRQMREELAEKPDELQNAILVGYIELTLNFCQRFYNRQFVTRKIENSDILVRFDRLLRDYFEDRLQLTLGLPTVQYCADKLCMSANYFGDVIKKTTGDTASSHIRQFVIQLAKNGLASGETVHPACQERSCLRRNRLSGVRPPRLRISPAFQPDVQEAGGRYAVGVLPEAADLMLRRFGDHFPNRLYSSSVTGSSHSLEEFSPGTSKARCANQLSAAAPCQCFTFAGMWMTSPGSICTAGLPSS